MKAKKLIFMFFGIVIIAVYVSLVVQVNSAYPKHERVFFQRGQTAFYEGYNSMGDFVSYGDIGVRASHVALLDYQGLKDIAPGYVDNLIENGKAGDLRALIVNVNVENYSDHPVDVLVRDFHAQSGAWNNGLHMSVMEKMGESSSELSQLKPGESREAALAFLMYDTQFNNSRDWQRIDSQDFELVLSVYPNRYSLDLGKPGLNASGE